jgi:hypothetical protein
VEAKVSLLRTKSGVLPPWQAYGCFSSLSSDYSIFTRVSVLAALVPGTLGPDVFTRGHVSAQMKGKPCFLQHALIAV